MILDLNNPAHCELVTRYITGEMDRLEQDLFEQQIHSKPQNSLVLKEMKSAWEISETYGAIVNIDKAWQRVQTNAGIGSESNTPLKVRKKRFVYALTVAASIIVLLSLGIILTLTKQSEWKIIQTMASNGQLVHTMPDSSIVYLSENSTLKYNQHFGTKTRDVELSGEGFFDIHHNPNKPFRIETQAVKIEVRGTSFLVKSANQESFELLVATGTVNVTSKIANEMLLATVGDKVHLIENSLVKSTNTNNLINPLKENKITFKDESLENIARILNKNFGITIIFEPSDLGKSQITATFKTNSAESILGVICETMQLDVRRVEDRTILTRKVHANP